MKKLLQVLFIFLLLGSCSDKETTGITDETEVIISGIVKKEKDDSFVKGVAVKMAKNGFTDTTDENGAYEFSFTGDEISSLGLDTTVSETLLFSYDDTILVYKDIENWSHQIDTIVLQLHSVESGLLGVDSLAKYFEICFFQEGNPTIFPSVPLGYSPTTKTITGDLLLPKLTVNDTYFFYINVFDVDSTAISRSDTTKIIGEFGPIKINSFSVDNLKPEIAPIENCTIKACDTLSLEASVSPKLDKELTQFEWLIDGALLAEATDSAYAELFISDDIEQLFQKHDTLEVEFKATDSDNLTASETFLLIFDKENPTALAGNDTTVTLNSKVTLKGSAKTIKNPVVKWEWKIGNEPFVQTPDGTILVDASYKLEDITCILKVTDSKSNTDEDTILVKCGFWEIVNPQINDTTCNDIAVLQHKLYIVGKTNEGGGTLYRFEKGEAADNTEDLTLLAGLTTSSHIASMDADYNYLYLLKQTNINGEYDSLEVVRFDGTEYNSLEELPVTFQGKQIVGKPQLTMFNEVPVIAVLLKTESTIKPHIYAYMPDGLWEINYNLPEFPKAGQYEIKTLNENVYFAAFDNEELSVRILDLGKKSWSQLGEHSFSSAYNSGFSLESLDLGDSAVIYLSFWNEQAKLSIKKFEDKEWTDHSSIFKKDGDDFIEDTIYNNKEDYPYTQLGNYCGLPYILYNNEFAAMLLINMTWYTYNLFTVNVRDGYTICDKGDFYFVYHDDKTSDGEIKILTIR